MLRRFYCTPYVYLRIIIIIILNVYAEFYRLVSPKSADRVDVRAAVRRTGLRVYAAVSVRTRRRFLFFIIIIDIPPTPVETRIVIL